MFFSDVDTAVNCFRPLVKKLKIRTTGGYEPSTCLIEVPELDFLGPVNWTLALVREKTTDSSCGRLITRYRKEHDCIQSIIYLDETLFFNTDISRGKRKIVALHEFCHFAACVYAYMADKEKFIKMIAERRNHKIGDIFNADVSTLYRLLNESEKDSEADKTINTFQHSQHAHFFLGVEAIGISYTDLFLNLLFSRGAFEEFFDLEKQREFFTLLRANKRTEAMNLYRNTAHAAAVEKWIPEKFALEQAREWLREYLRNPI
ncbi:MAG: hypothetical protein LBP32_07215 [Spirochaetaceae bacterium]|nr:hypothetical protein [Spirochaetaceae bacterium]